MLPLAMAIAALLLAAAPVSGHPLGNFSINHRSVVEISDGRVEVLYVLDEAEVPTASQRHLPCAEIRVDRVALPAPAADVRVRLVDLDDPHATAAQIAHQPSRVGAGRLDRITSSSPTARNQLSSARYLGAVAGKLSLASSAPR